MSTGLIALSLLATTAAGWWWRQPRASTSARAPRVTAADRMRITDPKRQARSVSRLWQLHANGCQYAAAKRLGGRRLDIDDTVPLAQAGAGSLGCRCYYRPLADSRRRARRGGDDRRAVLRFQLQGGERREHRERRLYREAWGEGRLR